jgi:hypothetical protein
MYASLIVFAIFHELFFACSIGSMINSITHVFALGVQRACKNVVFLQQNIKFIFL